MKERVKSGDFREDLYYRLNVFEINVPPLRVRRSDISILSAYFIERYSKVLKKEIIGLSNDVYNRFMEYNWPGNIRELSSVLERAVILAKTKLIQQCDLPQDLFMCEQVPQESLISNGGERESIVTALQEAKWNRSKAAVMLGMSRATLYLKLKRYGIN